MGDHLKRGSILFELRKFKEAEQEFRRELSEAPNSPVAHVWLARTLLSLRRNSEAHMEAKHTVRLDPHYAYGFYILSYTFDGLREMSQSFKAIEQAMAIDPEAPYIFARASDLQFAMRNFDRAEQLAVRGLAVDPEHLRSLTSRAVALIELSRIREAEAVLKSALSLAPEDSLAQLHMGAVQLQLGDKARAFDHFREALRLDPHEQRARTGALTALKAKNSLYYNALIAGFKLKKIARSKYFLAGVIACGIFYGFWVPESEAAHDQGLKITVYSLLIFLLLCGQFSVALMRFDPQGKKLLTPKEIRGNNLTAVALLVTIMLSAPFMFRTIGRAIKKTEQIPTDNKAYYQLLTERIKSNATDENEGVKDGECLLKFDIQRDGEITGLQIARSSTDAHIDALAKQAVMRSSPLPPLPAMSSKPLRIEFQLNFVHSDRPPRNSAR